MTSDKLTTLFGTGASIAALLAQQGLYPQYSGPVAAVLGTLFAYYTNKGTQTVVK